jgi:polygalacturonase
MSGGAKNLFVSDCSFIGTDIGLRFKTTRGRGGVVEKIFINNINMKDIAGEAILFDMYYMGKDPVPLTGEKRELPKTEFKPVDETTPVFKNFRISNVYCNGAEKAVFVRGLPEMHVSDILLENMVFRSKKGFDLQEASNIRFKNIKVISAETDPVIDIVQSNSISFDKMEFKKGASVLWRVSGDRVKKIDITHTDTSGAKEKLVVELGADPKEIKL